MSFINDTLSYTFSKYEGNTFLVDVARSETLTYADIKDYAYDIILSFEKQISKNSRIAVMLPNSVELVGVYFACLLGGYTVIPISPSIKREEFQYVLSVSKPNLLIVNKDFPYSDLAIENMNIFQFPSYNRSSIITSSQFKPIDEKQLFSITFTSGSTDKPKGVCHSVSNIIRNSILFQKSMNIDNDMRFIHILPMTYMAGFLNNIWCPFVSGASVVIEAVPNPFLIFSFWQQVAKSKVTHAWLPPSFLRSLLEMDRGDIEQLPLKAIFSATAPLSDELKNNFETRFHIPIYASYGMSETLINSIQRIDDNHNNSVGKLLDEHILRLSSDGELSIKTPALMLGYLNPETGETDIIDNNGYFATGDIAKLDSDDNLYILGRTKEMLIRGGKKHSPLAIEDTLKKHSAISNIVILGVYDKKQDNDIVVAFVVPCAKEDWSICEAEIKAYAQSVLDISARPDIWLQINDIPVTGPTSKVDRKELQRLAEEYILNKDRL